MGEHVVQQFIALLLGIWIARSLGVEGLGSLSFALSLHALFGIVTTLGLNRIVVRELSLAEAGAERDLIATAIVMRLSCGAAVSVLAVLACLLIAPHNAGLVAILVFGYFFSAFDVIELLFQSKLRSREVARTRMLAFMVSSGIKAGLLFHGAGVMMLAFACLLDWIFLAGALIFLYLTANRPFRPGRADMSIARRLFAESRLEIVAGFSGLAFMRLDQIMLEAMRGPAEVGIMAVSARLTEAWYFIPVAIVASNYPAIVRLRNSDPGRARARVTELYRSMIWLAITAGVAVSIGADLIVGVLYGPQYLSAGPVLIVQIWCGLFMSLGIASGAWLMANRLGHLNLRRNLVGAVVNVGLNFWLIPPYGALGAAWATLAAFAIAYLVYDFIDPAMREIGRDKLRAFAW